MKNSLITIIILMTFLIIGCGASLEKYQKEECLTPPGPAAQEIIKNKCLRCHGNDFNNPENICAYKSYIIDSVESGRMPKFGSLSDGDKKTLISWK